MSPGPWKAECDKPNARPPRMALVVTSNGISAIDCTNSGENYKQDCQNAVAIAALHDLLKVARFAVLRYYKTDDQFLVEMAEKAIAKAEGK